MRAVKGLLERGELGHVQAIQLTFHNAYGPDKPWFYDPQLSGGGCVIDLGIHLVDMALWGLGFPELADVRSSLFSGGRPLAESGGGVEDRAFAQIELAGGTSVQLACSWKLHAGRDCVISASFHGTEGGATFQNVGGSFYDFRAERHRGTETVTLTEPPDAWGGRAAVAWTEQLAAGGGFDEDVARVVDVARVLDKIYGR
jgi:predicted dehydrogenase